VTRNVHAVVLPESSGTDTAPLVAGLTPAERTRRALAETGVGTVPASTPDGVALLVASDALVEPAAVAALVTAAAPERAAMAAGDDPASPAALAISVKEATAHRPTTGEELATLAATLRADGRLQQVAVGEALCLRIRDSTTASDTAGVLLRRLVLPTDGFLARHFDRNLSRPLSVLLVRLGVHPNVVTAVATLVGLLGAGLLASMSRGWRVLGASTLVVSTILDGCDGEVARLSLRCSDLGRRLDLIGDNVVNAAVFIGMGVALARGADGGVPSALLGVTALGFSVATLTGFLFSNWLARTARTMSRNVYEQLAGRDFAYVVLALAIAGRLHWFLWMAAIGCYVFSGLVLAYWARTTYAAP
jgi:phosphatidylglycerophosphate synthase